MELASATRRAERLLVPAAFVTALGNNVQLIAGALLMIRSDNTTLAGGLLVQRLGAVPLLVFNAGTFVASAALVTAVGRRPGRTAARNAADAASTPAGDLPVRTKPAQLTWRIPLGRLVVLYAQGSVVV